MKFLDVLIGVSFNLNCIEHEKIQADFNFDESNPTLLENIEIITSENSKSTIILKYKSQDDLEVLLLYHKLI